MRDQGADEALVNWARLSRLSSAKYEIGLLPGVAVAEMAQGIGKLRRSGGTGRADRLDRWLDGLIAVYAERILPLNAQSARLAGQLSDAATANGCHPGFADVAIAALAQNAGLLLLTRNLKHFQPLGIACADPLVALPP